MNTSTYIIILYTYYYYCIIHAYIIILYTYDAFLFDFAKEDGKQCIVGLKQIINQDFPTKIQYGPNYGVLKAL